ncbi:MAG: tRNA uracil 4-sulfurtransferase ThiI [Promethearchaeota archaeon]
MSQPKPPDHVLVRYGEIGLKSPGVRRHLETLLHNHLSTMLKRHNTPFTDISRDRGRFFIQTPNVQKTAEISVKVFGVVSVSPTWRIPSQLETITSFISKLAPIILQKNQTFAIRARRLKTHAFTSQDIAKQVGAEVIQAMTARGEAVSVNLDSPDVEIHIEARQHQTYIFTQTLPGPGGFPYGSQGSVVGLHSGGLDSPVAQWLLMKRGARVFPLYFDSDAPNVARLRPRAIESAKVLAGWVPDAKFELLIIPYRDVLTQLQSSKNPKLTCILCKRMMYRIGAMVAAQKKAKGLVTGESLGQVASQTLTNLSILDSAIALPVFRPLIGLDKTETMALARRIGTYSASSQDVGDCFAVPKQPTIGALLDDVHSAESQLPIPEITQNALERLERVSIGEQKNLTVRR